MGLNRVVVLVALVGCVVSSVSASISHRQGSSALYPRQRRGSDQRLAELEALLTLTKFIKEKQAQEAMFENIGKRRKRQLVSDGLLPIEDTEYAEGNPVSVMAASMGLSPWDAASYGLETGGVPPGTFGSEDTRVPVNPVERYPWNRFKAHKQFPANLGSQDDAAQEKPATAQEQEGNHN